MIEPTETESKETLDAFAETLFRIIEEDADLLHDAPHTTPISRPDEVRAARQPMLAWPESITRVADCSPDHRPARARRVEHGGRRSAALDAVENGVATLRFYQWSEPTLSLGYFQRYDDREQHAASRDVRRRPPANGRRRDPARPRADLQPRTARRAIRSRSNAEQALRNCPRGIHRRTARRTRPQARSNRRLRIRGDRCRTASRRRTVPVFPAPSRRAMWSSSRSTSCRPIAPTRSPPRLERSWAAPSAVIAGPSCSTAACCGTLAGRPGACPACSDLDRSQLSRSKT